MRRLIGAIGLVAALFSAVTALAQDGRRVALVIGNGDYAAFSERTSATNDARQIGLGLDRLGFDVLLGDDVDHDDMRDLLDQFSGLLDGAEVGLFFFAGHAVQVDGENHLLPTDAIALSEPGLAHQAIDLDSVLALFDRPDLIGIALIDATQPGATGDASALTPGLAEVWVPHGTVLALSTQPGSAAPDGNGHRGVFASALLDRMMTSQVDVRRMLDQVALDIAAMTGGQQRPWVVGVHRHPGFVVGGQATETADVAVADSEPVADPVADPPVVAEEMADDIGIIDLSPLTSAQPPPGIGDVASGLIGQIAGDVARDAPAATISLSRHPAMDLPDHVLPGEQFPLLIWLSRSSVTPDVVVTPGPESTVDETGAIGMTLPEATDWTFRLVLNAPGFRIDGDGGPIAEITMTADGDSTPALFLLSTEAGAHPDGHATLRATLWHDATYLASIERTVNVGVVQADGEPDRPSSASLDPIRIDTTLRTADLTIRVDYDNPAILGAGQVIIASPHFRNPLIVGTIDTPADVDDWLAHNYRQFVSARTSDIAAARGGTHVNGGEADMPMTEPLLRGFGQELYRRYAPDVFKQALWALVDDPAVTLETIQVYSNNPVLPWELMRPTDTEGGTLDFLGMEFQIARWHGAIGSSAFDRPQQTVVFDELVAIAPDYDAGDALASVKAEIDALREMPGFREVRGRIGALQTLFSQPPRGIIHFAGHGVVSDDGATGGLRDYMIKLEDRNLNVMAWRGLGAGLADDGVFYFFNACDVGQAGYVANFVEGWAPAVLEAGASGFIGGLWPVFDDSAADFAARFYADIDARLADGPAPVADVLRDLRAHFAATGDPTYLGYVYYGDVNLHLTRD